MQVEQHRAAESRAGPFQQVGERGVIRAMIGRDPGDDLRAGKAPPPQFAGAARPARDDAQPAAHLGGWRPVGGVVVHGGVALMLGAVEVDPRAAQPLDDQRLASARGQRDRVDMAILQRGE